MDYYLVMDDKERNELIRQAAEGYHGRTSSSPDPAGPAAPPPEQTEQPTAGKKLPSGMRERLFKEEVPPAQVPTPEPAPVQPEQALVQPAPVAPPAERKSAWKNWVENKKTPIGRTFWRLADGYFNQFDWRDKNKLAWGSGIFAGAGGVLLVAEAGATLGLSPMLRGATTFAVLQGSRLIYEGLHGKYVAGALSVVNTEELRVKILNKEREMAAKKLHGAAFETEYQAILTDLLKDHVAAEHLEHYQRRLLRIGREYAAVNRVMRSLTAGLAFGAVGGAITEGLIDRLFRVGAPEVVPSPKQAPEAQPTPKPVATAESTPTATSTAESTTPPKPVVTPVSTETQVPDKPAAPRPAVTPRGSSFIRPLPLEQGVNPIDIPGTPEFEAERAKVFAQGDRFGPDFYIKNVPSAARGVMEGIMNNPDFAESIAGEVGYHKPILEKMVDEIARDFISKGEGVNADNIKKANQYLIRELQEISNDSYHHKALLAVKAGNVDPNTVLDGVVGKSHDEVSKWIASEKTQQLLKDDVRKILARLADDEKDKFYGKVMHGFEVNPGMVSEVPIKPGINVSRMLVEVGFDLKGTNAARPMAATIAANWDTLTEMWQNMQQSYPTMLEGFYYPVSILELNDLVIKAEAGDQEALKKLWAALKWIPAGKKLRIIKNEYMQQFLDNVK